MPSLPPMPSGDFDDQGLLTRVTFFGCNNMDKTTIIYDPMRIIKSGVSGVATTKGVMNAKILNWSPDVYDDKNVNRTVENSAASFPDIENDFESSFDTCFSCLLYAKAKGSNTFMKEGDGTILLLDPCRPCYAQYCWEGRPDYQTPHPQYPL